LLPLFITASWLDKLPVRARARRRRVRPVKHAAPRVAAHVAIFVALIFLGWPLTGWHYLIDAIAGVLLAWIRYASVACASKLSRWVRLREALRKQGLSS
jgi:hypothetical protein